MDKLQTLRAKLERAEAKKLSAEAEIRELKKKIEQEEISAVKALMQEHEVSYDELAEMIRRINNKSELEQV